MLLKVYQYIHMPIVFLIAYDLLKVYRDTDVIIAFHIACDCRR